jgi:hypothetical protein
MNANDWIRQFHRWISIIFTLTVIANFAAMALRKGLPPPWITYAPLLPLALLLFTGLYLFARPYFSRDHTRRRPGSAGGEHAPSA